MNKEDTHSLGRLVQELSNRSASRRILSTAILLFVCTLKYHCDGRLGATAQTERSCLCAGGGNMGQSPGHMSPRGVQLVRCLRPSGELSHSQGGSRAEPGGGCGQCSVESMLPLQQPCLYSLFYCRLELQPGHTHVCVCVCAFSCVLSLSHFRSRLAGFSPPPAFMLDQQL